MKSRKRDDLIERVKYGRMTPAEAEAEAARLGLIPLATSPDPLKHNPLGEAWWSLPMVVAWIMWRDPKAVLDCFDPYRTQFWEWHYEEWRVGPDGPIQKGHFLKQRRRATLSQLRLSESYDASTDTLRESSHKVADATALLWKALQDNVLQATGIPNDDEERRPIPDYKWRDLELIEERGRDAVRYGSLSSRGYNDVVFPRDSIFTLWPELALQRQLELPPTIRPDGPGYFPLYSAAQWIATQGGIRDFDPTDSSIWMAAYSELTARIASDHVAITGARNGIREKIGGHIFASMRVDYPFADTSFDLILSDELYLCSYPYIDDEHWRGGLDDSLQTRAGTQWSKLMVLKSDIAQFWPFSPGDLIQVDDAPGFRTSAPGRLTPMHIVVAEHDRRLADGEAVVSVSAKAKHLAAWLKQSYPTVPPLTPKTIENRIRDAHRKAKIPPK